MKNFIINTNGFLATKTRGFYHTEYTGFGQPNNPAYINTLKNLFGSESRFNLNTAVNELSNVLASDLPRLHGELQSTLQGNSNIVVCTIPRSKGASRFSKNQLLFKSTVRNVVNSNKLFVDGLDYINRVKNTRTTHLTSETTSFINDGRRPYKGITLNTCTISQEVVGKDILLIDDVYTWDRNIVEDAIQALYTIGAKNIVFYAIGKSIQKFYK